MNKHTAEPTRAELEIAWATLRRAGVVTICNMSIHTLADIANGSPPHAPGRYSGAEVRMAHGMLVLQAALLDSERARQVEKDARAAPAPQLALGLGA